MGHLSLEDFSASYPPPQGTVIDCSSSTHSQASIKSKSKLKPSTLLSIKSKPT